jgi:glucose/mannose-6-phosphate isomerase
VNREWRERLDDSARLGSIDAGSMLAHLAAFDSMLAGSWQEPPPIAVSRPPERVLLGGMGGSAIAGDLLAGLLAERGRARLETVRDYVWPALDEGDLIIVCSYSGETEESLALYAAARATGLPLLTLSSGGSLRDLAKADGLPHLSLESERGPMPPRAALPLMLGRLLGFLDWLGGDFALSLDRADLLDALAAVQSDCAATRPCDANPAKALALELGAGRPVFTALAPAYAAVALRLRCQFEENAKGFALSRSLPELHHNSWIPWLGGDPPGLPVWLGEADAHPRVLLRRRLSEEALGKAGMRALAVPSRGEQSPSRVLTSLLLGDYLGAYHALMRGVDPSPTESLDAMKQRLASMRERE